MTDLLKKLSPSNQANTKSLNTALNTSFSKTWFVLLSALLALYAALRLACLGLMVTHVDELAMLKDLSSTESHRLFSGLAGFRNYTFAPFQFVFTYFFLLPVKSGQALVYMGRLVSFLLWGLGLLGLAALLRELRRPWPALNPALLALAFCLPLFSWRGIIESSQAYNYATCLGVAVLFCSFYLLNPLAYAGARQIRYWAAALCLAVGFNYQAIFLGAAVLPLLFLEQLKKGDRSALRRLAWVAVPFSVACATAFLFHILKLQREHGVGTRFPAWAAGLGYPPLGAGLWQTIAFFPGAWFHVFENNFTFFPWGWPTRVWTLLLLGAAAIGWLLSLGKQSNPWQWRLLALCASLVAVWSLGCVMGKLPLSPTRHTYVLQVPLLLFILAGLGQWNLNSAFWRDLLLLGWATFFLTYPTLVEHTREHVNFEKIQSLLQSEPNSVAIGMPGSVQIWDDFLWIKQHPDWRWRVYSGGLPSPQQAKAFNPLILFSNTDRLTPVLAAKLAELGYHRLEILDEVEPTGSTELCGRINGGNGFFLYQAFH